MVTPPPEGLLTAYARHDDSSPRTIDVGNSGTTLYLLTALAALSSRPVRFDGDQSIRTRGALPLLNALETLGARVESSSDTPGCVPYVVCGPLREGRSVSIESPTSQYLSALLLSAPLIGDNQHTTEITVTTLNEHPYIDLTCTWLDRHNVHYTRDEYRSFRIKGGQYYTPLTLSVPGDYSSATFWFCAAAITGSTIEVAGLDPNDAQGDRGVLAILQELGCTIDQGERSVTITGRLERGGTFDLNAMPDSLPALSVVGCATPHPLTLTNVAIARAKETDRIAVMGEELRVLGARVEEHPDGITIYPSPLRGGRVSSHGDHRIAMALAIASLIATEAVTVEGSSAAAVTYPSFFDDLARLSQGNAV